MNSIALTGIRKMDLIRGADPVIHNENDVIVRVSHVGVCGSDMHLYAEGHIGDNWVDYPFVLGHEGVGIVDAAGANRTGNPDKQDVVSLIRKEEPYGLDCVFDCCGKGEYRPTGHPPVFVFPDK